jgi:alanyl-tRNA synthetase
MTTRLYYTDAYRRAFEAIVLTCEARGDGFETVLDVTAFYPTSGGQPADRGTLGEVRVLDVVDADDGRVVHVVDRALGAGASVAGMVDWDRRFDHMQQHTGQHVLSAAFDRLFGARTESFHLGVEAATIDLGREVSRGEIDAAELEANRIVWEDRPVTVRFAAAAEAAALPLRKESRRSGSLRLIDIEDFDLSACGGTHVARTGGIGIIATTSWEKVRRGTRIEFVCGGRALDRHRSSRDALANTTRHLSVLPRDLAPAVEKLQADLKSLQKTSRLLQERLAVHDARALLERGVATSDGLIVVEAIEGWDAVGLKALALAATLAEPTARVALFNQTTPALAVVARGTRAGGDASATLRSLIAVFGGKGGGKPDLAQGGGLNAATDVLIAEARRLLAVAGPVPR